MTQFNNSYAQLPDVFFTRQSPTASPNPSPISLNHTLASQLGFADGFLDTPEGLAMVSGQSVPETADPLAMVYAGHQFAGWSPRLGDGRALLLGEVLNNNNQRFDIQLKGSGITPYSRNGDGKAGIGPVVREYILSEAMHALNVPTTRALAAVRTGEDILRNGYEPGAVFTRVAQSHVRVGTFQYFFAQNDTAALQTLADYVINRHYPDAAKAENPIKAAFQEIMERQAYLIVDWMRFGFIHGVMNTDNCQIAGETIDYGPCAFMDEFHPARVFSSIDQKGRYAWNNQPSMIHWNLIRLGESLIPIWGASEEQAKEDINSVMDAFSPLFNDAFVDAFTNKLGLGELGDEDTKFISQTFTTMTEHSIDFTLFFSYLRRLNNTSFHNRFIALFKQEDAGNSWLKDWEKLKDSTGISASESQTKLNASNPIYIARNHRVEQAIQAAIKGNYAPMNRLNEVLSTPFDVQKNAEEFEKPPQTDERVTQTFCGT